MVDPDIGASRDALRTDDEVVERYVNPTLCVCGRVLLVHWLNNDTHSSPYVVLKTSINYLM